MGRMKGQLGNFLGEKDREYLIYLPVSLAEDSMFPFQDWGKGRKGVPGSIEVKVSFEPGGEKKLTIEEWKEKSKTVTSEHP